MKRVLVVVSLVLLSLSLVAQTTKSKDAKKATSKQAAAGAPDKALMQEIWAAWSTLDPANAAKFYAKGASHTFYDLAPMKYESWAEYEQGVKSLLAGFKSARMEVNDDARVHHAGSLAWGTATWHGDFENKDGSQTAMDGRWTVVWEKRKGEWLIVHEHASVPMPPEPEAK
jgi:ketosteroid isomerase-like protein